MLPKLLPLLFAAATAMSAAAYTPITLPVIPADPQLEKKVAQKVATMSLDEKIGQMIQLQIDIIGDHDADGVFHFSQAKADSVIGTYKVGSFLNTPGTTCLTAAEWCQLIPKIQETSLRLTGIPTIYGLDQNHGILKMLVEHIKNSACKSPHKEKRGDEYEGEGEFLAYESTHCWLLSEVLVMYVLQN